MMHEWGRIIGMLTYEPWRSRSTELVISLVVIVILLLALHGLMI